MFAKYKPLKFVLKLDDKDQHIIMQDAPCEAEERIVKVPVLLLTDGRDVDNEQEMISLEAYQNHEEYMVEDLDSDEQRGVVNRCIAVIIMHEDGNSVESVSP